MLDFNDDKPVGVEEVLEVVKDAKLITKVVTTAGVDVNVASVQDTPITAAEANKVIVLRKRRGVIIQDPEETTTTVTVQPKAFLQVRDVKRTMNSTQLLWEFKSIGNSSNLGKNLESSFDDHGWLEYDSLSERFLGCFVDYFWPSELTIPNLSPTDG
nr:hypothetical protein [Tanacetum cinerariifolium]